MLQKQHRLPAASRLQNPSTFHKSSFFVKVSTNSLSVSRFGFVVRKTIDKKATTRNRIRRVFRSCVEELLPEIRSGFDMLFFLNSKTLEMTREELYNEVHTFFKEKQFLR